MLRDGGLLGTTVAVGSKTSTDDTLLPCLRSGEVALLLAAPFLREAVLAVGLRDAAAIDPVNLDRTYETGPRGDLELTHEMHQHIVRRAVGCDAGLGTNPDLRPPMRATSWRCGWYTAGWRAESPSGRRPGQPTSYPRRKVSVAGCRGTANEAEVPRLISVLLLAIGADSADGWLLTRLASRYVSDRWRMIASVLWLAVGYGGRPEAVVASGGRPGRHKDEPPA